MNTLIRKLSSFWLWSYVSVAIMGSIVVWVVGHRGICFYDQSGIFDGGWRMMQGQVLYRDFFTPYGPMTFWIQSMFFRLAGVDFSSMVLSAAVINGLAVLCVIRLVRRLLPDPLHRPTAIAAGLVTAVWFQAPFGTLWFEQTAFFFNLIAMVLLMETPTSSERAAICLRLLAGCSLAFAVLSKQSAGVVLMPVPLGVAVITCLPHWRKSLAALFQVIAGIFLVSIVFLVWLWGFSSPTGFWQSVVVMTGTLAGRRFGGMGDILSLIRLKMTWNFVSVPLLAFFIFGVSPRSFKTSNSVLISWIILSYIFLQNFFAAITRQDVYNNVVYIGLINGLAFGLLSRVYWRKRLTGQPDLQYWARVAVTLVSVCYLFYWPIRYGWNYSASRIVQQYEGDAPFVERVQATGTSRLLWRNPTVHGTLTRKDFEDLNAWLDSTDANFFVIPDSTLLYGLHKRVSPQPWLYFIPNHSFPLSDLLHVDAVVVESLQKNKVSVIVVEKATWSQNEELIEKMPMLKAWMQSQFEKTKEFGTAYEVWTLRTSTAPKIG